jgi:hypothetical protein
MMRQLQTLWPRKVGLEWNLTKLHEQFHVPFDIHRHGKHKNVHSGPQEHNHISVKNAAKKTQMNRRTFDEQTGERLVDRLIIQRAYDRVAPLKTAILTRRTPRDGYAQPSRNSSKATMIYQTQPELGRDKASMNLVWKNQANTKNRPILADSVLGFVGKQLLPAYGNVVPATDTHPAHKKLEIAYFTEYERDGIIYRAHPCYRGGPAWYDWAYVSWTFDGDGRNRQETHQSLIGRILCFFRHPQGELMAVVHSVDAKLNEQHGVFATYWHLEFANVNQSRPKLSMVPVDCLGDQVCMVPYDEVASYRWLHIWNPIEWSACFQNIEPPTD